MQGKLGAKVVAAAKVEAEPTGGRKKEREGKAERGSNRADKTLLRLSLPNRRSQQRILGKVAAAARYLRHQRQLG